MAEEDESYRDSEEVSRVLTDADRTLIERHDALYLEILHCTDIEEYKRLNREYAALDMKVARLKNKDKTSLNRCALENSYKLVDRG